MIIPMNYGVAGFFKLSAINAKTGKRRDLTGWFPNLITDFGLNRMGSVDSGFTLLVNRCAVGSGTTAPLNTDTSLQTLVAWDNNTPPPASSGAQASEPYYGFYRRTYRWNEGAAAGNLSEIGVAEAETSLFSRALILDGLGDPTTITVLASEILEAVYELRQYPPLTDAVYTVSDGADSYSVTVRAANVTSSSPFEPSWGGTNVSRKKIFEGTCFAFDGAIGPITGEPSGSQGQSTGNIGNNAYSNNSLEMTGQAFFSIDSCNFAGGIRSIRFGRESGGGAFQAEFNPPIPKDNTKELTIGLKMSWGRYTP